MKVAVTGWYGNGNIGDELLARSTVDCLRRVLPSPEVVLLTHRPGSDPEYPGCAPLFLGEDGAIKNAFRIVRHAVRTKGRWPRLAAGLDLVVVGGGSLFHDRQPGNLRLWIETLRLYRKLGSSVVLYGVTVDPVEDAASREEQRELLALADRVTLRDAGSAEWVEALVGPGRAVLAADPVLDSDLLPDRVPVAVASSGSGAKRIGLNVRPLSGVADEELVREAVDLARALLRRFDGSLRFIPMWPGDVALGREIGRALGAGPRYEMVEHDPSRLPAHVASYQGLDAVVAMRLHTLELAAASGVPVVGLAYDPKVSAFLGELSLDDACRAVSRADGSGFRGFDCDWTVGKVHDLLTRWDRLGPVARDGLEALRRRGANNAASLRAWHAARARPEGPEGDELEVAAARELGGPGS